MLVEHDARVEIVSNTLSQSSLESDSENIEDTAFLARIINAIKEKTDVTAEELNEFVGKNLNWILKEWSQWTSLFLIIFDEIVLSP